MTTRIQVVVAAAVVGLAGGFCAEAQTLTANAAGDWRMPPVARQGLPGVQTGSIASTVHDASGAPVAGAIVSAVGSRTVSGTTDASGRCVLPLLSPGEYLVRVHRVGFTPANSLTVRVGAGADAHHRVVLRPTTPAAATRRTESPEIMAAGFLPPVQRSDDAAADASAADSEGSHDHGETAWRLRHLRRSVLKDAVGQVEVEQIEAIGEDDDGAAEFFGRAVSAPARAAAALFADVPFTGEVNILTTSTFDSPTQWLSDGLAQGVAYVSLGAAAGRQGDWVMEAATTQGDVASWMVSGSFVARSPATHRYEAGMTYAAQQYTGRNPAALQSVADGTRNAGAVFAYDTWTIARGATLVFGARYARYGYLDEALFSPRARLQFSPVSHVRMNVSASRRAEAPGAEEFLPALGSESWMPPQRTFSTLAGAPFRPERTDTYSAGVEHDINGGAVLGVRTFYQRTTDQVATLFGLGIRRNSGDLDHYYVATAGDFVARGWTVSVSQVVARNLRGSVDYTVTTAHWTSGQDAAAILPWAPAALRRSSERLHDLTAALEAQVPISATRVFALYRVNTAYARAGSAESQPGPGPAARFDVQVTQSLPFLDFSSAQWEMLVGVRNLFRAVAADASIYDELLVLRPPKRVVGGLTVRF